MVMIKIEQTKIKDGWIFEVEVTEDMSQSTHQVQLEKDFYTSLDIDATPKELVEESFRFLLERESKESILSQFYIQEIEDYFSDYKEQIQNRL
jgi:hypothetical protein